MVSLPDTLTPSFLQSTESSVRGPNNPIEFFQAISRISTDPIEGFTYLQQKYGDIVRFYNPAMRETTFLITDPNYVQHVLHDNQSQYRKADQNKFLQLVLGQGLLTSHGDQWLQQRRLIAPMFHRKSIRTFIEFMVDDTRSMLDRWEQYADENRTFNLAKEIRRVTLDIVGRSLFSTPMEELGGDVGEALKTVSAFVNKRSMSFIRVPMWVPLPSHHEFKEAKAVLDDIVSDLIQHRRGQAEEYEDMLSMLMLAEDEETGETMNDQQVHDEVMTFMLAGHETTANAISWTSYLLSTHPDVEEKLRCTMNDLDEFQNNPFEAFQEFDYVKQVVREGMRLYPPAWVTGRSPLEDDTLNSHTVPEASTLIMPIYLLHHHPEWWDEPERFKPERFSENSDEPRHKYVYIPFGAGRRICIGREFAMVEAQIILTMINQRFRLTLEQREPIEYQTNVTLQPKHGIKVSLDRWE